MGSALVFPTCPLDFRAGPDLACESCTPGIRPRHERYCTWRSDWATSPPISPPRRPKARSTSTTGSATAGACSSRTRRTSRRSAPPSSATVAKLKPEFDKRNVKVIGLSVDALDNHKSWAADIEETQGAKLNFPMIADSDRKVSDLYDMIHPNANDTLTVRSVFIIGADKKVKLIITYPASHRSQLRRDPAGHRLAAAHRQLPGRDAGELEGRRGRHHRARRLRRGREEASSPRAGRRSSRTCG